MLDSGRHKNTYTCHKRRTSHDPGLLTLQLITVYVLANVEFTMMINNTDTTTNLEYQINSRNVYQYTLFKLWYCLHEVRKTFTKIFIWLTNKILIIYLVILKNTQWCGICKEKNTFKKKLISSWFFASLWVKQLFTNKICSYHKRKNN